MKKFILLGFILTLLFSCESKVNDQATNQVIEDYGLENYEVSNEVLNKKPINFKTLKGKYLGEGRRMWSDEMYLEPYSGPVFAKTRRGWNIEGMLIDGLQEGLWLEYNGDLSIRIETEYKDGFKNGKRTIYRNDIMDEVQIFKDNLVVK